MLVLSRKKNERISLETEHGEVLSFVVIEIRGDKVRIGIEAPKSVKILRDELIPKGGKVSDVYAHKEKEKQVVSDFADAVTNQIGSDLEQAAKMLTNRKLSDIVADRSNKKKPK